MRQAEMNSGGRIGGTTRFWPSHPTTRQDRKDRVASMPERSRRQIHGAERIPRSWIGSGASLKSRNGGVSMIRAGCTADGARDGTVSSPHCWNRVRFADCGPHTGRNTARATGNPDSRPYDSHSLARHCRLSRMGGRVSCRSRGRGPREALGDPLGDCIGL